MSLGTLSSIRSMGLLSWWPVFLLGICSQQAHQWKWVLSFPGVEPEPFEVGEHLIEASGKLHLLDRLLAFLYSG